MIHLRLFHRAGNILSYFLGWLLLQARGSSHSLLCAELSQGGAATGLPARPLQTNLCPLCGQPQRLPQPWLPFCFRKLGVPVFLWVSPPTHSFPAARAKESPLFHCGQGSREREREPSSDLADLVLQLWGCWDG